MHEHTNEPGADRDEPEMSGVVLIAALRGGFPERCDFCNQGYTAERYPVPEEAGLWACNECFERWEELDEEQRRRESP